MQSYFNKASHSYDGVAHIQKKSAQFLVEKLCECPAFNPKTLLDLGTGTGYIPELLLPRLPECTFHLNDLSNEMLTVCQSKFSQYFNIHYLPEDMLHLNADIYDCIISNLALQWMDDFYNF